jgi:hypothetical protein
VKVSVCFRGSTQTDSVQTGTFLQERGSCPGSIIIKGPKRRDQELSSLLQLYYHTDIILLLLLSSVEVRTVFRQAQYHTTLFPGS